MEAVRVLIADGQALFRAGLRAFMGSQTSVEIVGEASTGEEAMARYFERAPDLLLMDARMAGLSGIEVTRRIVRSDPTARVVLLTTPEDDAIVGAMRAGARGCLLRSTDPDELLHTVHAVSAGSVVFGPAVGERVLTYFRRSRPAFSLDVFPELTDREREVLDLVACGLGNAAIARTLAIAEKTARNHVSNIFGKLQASDRAQAIVRARAAGFGHARP